MIATGKGFVGILDDDHPIQAHQNASAGSSLNRQGKTIVGQI